MIFVASAVHLELMVSGDRLTLVAGTKVSCVHNVNIHVIPSAMLLFVTADSLPFAFATSIEDHIEVVTRRAGKE